LLYILLLYQIVGEIKAFAGQKGGLSAGKGINETKKD
jgi:hypothetical protein